MKLNKNIGSDKYRPATKDNSTKKKTNAGANDNKFNDKK